jgi:hypothetical protein
MGNRIFIAVVVMLWTGTMSWLMVSRILPPFFHGEPPIQSTVAETEPNCWQIEFGGQKVGYAVSQTVPGDLGTTEVHSRVKLDDIKLRRLLPFQFGSLIHGSGAIDLDMRARLALDSLGNLSSFDTRVQVNEMPLVLIVRGQVEGAELRVKLTAGEFTREERFPAPASALLANELLPEARLLGVDVGRKWQQEVFSPFTTSVQLVQAEVMDEGYIQHRGERRKVRRIEYRSLSAAGVAADNTLRSVVWVAEDGNVLRQEVQLLNAALRFERCFEPEKIELARKLLDLKSMATISAEVQ